MSVRKQCEFWHLLGVMLDVVIFIFHYSVQLK